MFAAASGGRGRRSGQPAWCASRFMLRAGSLVASLPAPGAAAAHPAHCSRHLASVGLRTAGLARYHQRNYCREVRLRGMSLFSSSRRRVVASSRRRVNVSKDRPSPSPYASWNASENHQESFSHERWGPENCNIRADTPEGPHAVTRNGLEKNFACLK